MANYRIDFGGDEDLERRYVEALKRAIDSTFRQKEMRKLMTTFTTQDRENAERRPVGAKELADELEKSSSLWFTDDMVAKWVIESLRNQAAYINRLHQLLNKNGIGVGKNLLTGEVIPFEEEK